MNLEKHSYVFMLAFIILSVTGSCKKSTKEIETTCFRTAIEKLKVDDHTKWIVVLPGLGCNGCIQEAEVFMRDYVKNSDIFFVLTNISSLKLLQQKIGVQIRDYPNVYIDRNNVFSIPTDNSIYPCIIRVKNSKIKEHEFQSPQNSAAFMKLKELVIAH